MIRHLEVTEQTFTAETHGSTDAHHKEDAESGSNEIKNSTQRIIHVTRAPLCFFVEPPYLGDVRGTGRVLCALRVSVVRGDLVSIAALNLPGVCKTLTRVA